MWQQTSIRQQLYAKYLALCRAAGHVLTQAEAREQGFDTNNLVYYYGNHQELYREMEHVLRAEQGKPQAVVLKQNLPPLVTPLATPSNWQRTVRRKKEERVMRSKKTEVKEVQVAEVSKRRGRPKGSKNKPKEDAATKAPKKAGRPKKAEAAKKAPKAPKKTAAPKAVIATLELKITVPGMPAPIVLEFAVK